MVKAVIDANVFVSGFLRDGTARRILEAYEENKFLLCLSPSLLDEISSVLRRPKFSKSVSTSDVEEFISIIESSGLLILPTKSVSICRDPKDDHILACALEASADFIVTGDKDLLILKSFRQILILSPVEFLRKL